MHDIKIPDDDEEAPRGRHEGHQDDEQDEREEHDGEPSEYVRVKFAKFVQLVATHNFEEAIRSHGDEDVVVPTNLLTDLANAHEEEGHGDKKKLPIIFLVGIILGIVATFLALKF